MAGSVPYIGSRMNLISKAEIRYEGFLHEIDTTNTTVTLRNVRSFGTEQRRADKVIPPKDDVFQYIIFRGSDIKDISVCDSPFLDPAIVQSGPPAPGAANQKGNTQTGSGGTGADSSSQSPSFAFGMPSNPQQAKPQPPSVPSPQLFQESAESHQSPEPNDHPESGNNRQHPKPISNRGAGNRNEGSRPYGSARESQGNAWQYNNANRQYSNGRVFNSYRGGGFDYDSARHYNSTYSSYSGGYRNTQNTQPLMSSNSQRGYNRTYGQVAGRFAQNSSRFNPSAGNARGTRPATASGGDNLKIDEDFDIDDANKKFDKSQLIKEFSDLSVGGDDTVQVQELNEVEEGELGEEKGTDSAKFYDKAKSFFDNISCDALEKKQSRLTSAEEKKLNAQTFGVSTVFRNTRGMGNNNGFNQRNLGYNSRRGGGNYYGGFSNSGNGNYRRGPGANNYYTQNYMGSGNGSNFRRGGSANRRPQRPSQPADVLVQS